MKRIVITGGAGFVGANLAIYLNQCFESVEIIALDNLFRDGSSLNISRLRAHGVNFIHGDVRVADDLERLGKFDFLIECSAEPSVLAGKDGNTRYLMDTNLSGAVNCVEVCRKWCAGMIFLSTSRVYPLGLLRHSLYHETKNRFEWFDDQKLPGLSQAGISEEFPLLGERSLYGASKYAAEIILSEYAHAHSIPIIINRCGLVAGQWQFGKIDQGVITLWVSAHLFQRPLSYIGFQGKGKQVRDILHIEDLAKLIYLQLRSPETFTKKQFNIGGGYERSLSLLELTQLCRAIVGNTVEIGQEPKNRYADIPIYITDIQKIKALCGWEPIATTDKIVEDIHKWLVDTPLVHSLFQINS